MHMQHPLGPYTLAALTFERLLIAVNQRHQDESPSTRDRPCSMVDLSKKEHRPTGLRSCAEIAVLKVSATALELVERVQLQYE